MFRHVLLLIILGLISQGCGAPTKSTSDVSHLFTVAASLDEKVQGICAAIEKRDSAPTLEKSAFKIADCKNAGLIAVDLKGTLPLYFQGLDLGTAKQSQVVRMSGRSQVWLNHSLLGMASILIDSLKSFADKNPKAGDIIAIKTEAVGPFADLIKPTVTLIQKPIFDREKLEFSGKINININGTIKADHDIELVGKVIDQKVVITVRTLQDRTYDKSLLNRFTGIIMIVPHASDIYLDFLVSVDVNDPGVGSEVLKSQLSKVLASGLNAIIEGVRKL